MQCKRCDSEINAGWTFCPSCGAKVPQRNPGIGNFFSMGLEDVFNRFVSKSMEDMFKNFEHADSVFEPRQAQRGRAFKGMTVKIVQSGNNPPIINVERFDGSRRGHTAAYSPMIPADEMHSGVPRLENIGRSNSYASQANALSKSRHETVAPKTTVEPKTDIVRLPGKIVLESELPGVKSINDVQVLEFGESLEIRAFAGKKAYVKIVQIPHEIHVNEKAFSGEKLRVELGK